MCKIHFKTQTTHQRQYVRKEENNKITCAWFPLLLCRESKPWSFPSPPHYQVTLPFPCQTHHSKERIPAFPLCPARQQGGNATEVDCQGSNWYQGGWEGWDGGAEQARMGVLERCALLQCSMCHSGEQGWWAGDVVLTPHPKGCMCWSREEHLVQREGKVMERELLPTIAQVLCFLIPIFCMTAGAKSWVFFCRQQMGALCARLSFPPPWACTVLDVLIYTGSQWGCSGRVNTLS